MSLTATAHSVPGTLRQTGVIDGQHRLITDEPQRLGGDLNDTQLERLEKVARSCPLRHSIETGIEFVETFEREQPAARKPVQLGAS